MNCDLSEDFVLKLNRLKKLSISLLQKELSLAPSFSLESKYFIVLLSSQECKTVELTLLSCWWIMNEFQAQTLLINCKQYSNQTQSKKLNLLYLYNAEQMCTCASSRHTSSSTSVTSGVTRKQRLTSAPRGGSRSRRLAWWRRPPTPSPGAHPASPSLYWPLISWEWSHVRDTASDWSSVITWPGHRPLIGPASPSHLSVPPIKTEANGVCLELVQQTELNVESGVWLSG